MDFSCGKSNGDPNFGGVYASKGQEYYTCRVEKDRLEISPAWIEIHKLRTS
jgi:hypothetical protein